MNKWLYRFGVYGIGLMIGSVISYYYVDVRSTTVRLKNGDEAPAILGKKLDGSSFELKDYRGDIVLLEFWASESASSRANSIQMKALNDEYKDVVFKDSTSFKLVSVAIESDRKAWEKVVSEDLREWENASDFQGRDSKVLNDYALTEFPTCYLLNKEGVIIAKTSNYKILKFALDEKR